MAFASAAYCQAMLNFGELAGSVTDGNKHAVAGASVTLADRARGVSLNAASDSEGGFRLALVPPGIYQLTVSAQGFADRSLDAVEIAVGGNTRLDVELSAQQARFSTTATAEIPALDTERTQQSTLIDTTRMRALPINRRNYLDFVLLSPGVVDTTSFADSTDFRVASTPTSNLGFAGSTGRGNTFFVDGAENNGSVGNVRPSLSQDAVQEFQVNRNSYSAEFGGAYGGAVNIVSRSGSNQLHGGLFGYLRDRDLEARNYFDPGKSAYTRVQAGASAGGPLRRDRTFFFGAVERLELHQTAFLPSLENPAVLNSPTASQQEVASYLNSTGSAALGGALTAVLTPSLNPTVVPLFRDNTGVLPFSSHGTQASLRVDHKLSERNELFVRANLTIATDQNTRFGAQEGRNRGVSDEYWDGAAAVQDTFRISPSWISVSRGAFAYDRFTVLPNDPLGPALDILGYGGFGRNLQAPSSQRDRHFQGQEIVSHSSARQSLKFGVDINPVRNDSNPQVFFGGRFIFAEAFPLALVLDQLAGVPGYSTQLAAANPKLAPNLAQPISSLQAYALGLPVAYIQGFGNPRQTNWERRYSGFAEQSLHPAANLALTLGLRYEHEGNQYIGGLDNLAPRFGFAWSPRGRSDWAVRGGFGFFESTVDFYAVYSAVGLSRPDLNVVVVPVTGVPVTNPQTGAPLNSIDIYQSLLAGGVLGHRSIVYSDLAKLGLPAGFRFPLTGGLSGDFRNPYSEQASFEVEHAIGSTAFSAAWNFSRTLRMPRTLDANLYQAGTRPDGWPIFGQVNPNLANNYIMSSTANSYYHALVLQVNRRFLRHWALNGHYTWSKAIDDTSDYHMDYMPQNQLEARADRALSSFHRGHRLVATSVMESPWHAAAGSGAGRYLLSDWTFSWIVQAMSAQPFNVLTGYDNVGDGQSNTHRPLGLGRNVGVGPGFFSIDTRVGRAWRFGADGARRIDFTAEAFNLLNRTNFQSVNNIVGALPLSALPHPLTGFRGDPTTPFAFTSAKDPRQIQLGLRISF